MIYNKSWENFINKSIHFQKMVDFVENERDICPLKENVFRFLNTDLKNIKCVILGMDPYKSTYIKDGIERPVATGRAFEVENVDRFMDKYKEKSLATIFKSLCYYKFGKVYTMDELRDDKILSKLKYIRVKEWFDDMEKNGVLFLNAVLTTKIGKTGSHIAVWTDFMDELLKFIDSYRKPMWLIWGNVALNRVNEIVDSENIIYSCHPASRVNNDFIENCSFKKVKDINWF